MKTKISVAMCTYNGERYIREQLNSILCQSVLPNEIIICDDISNDNTEKTVLEIINKNEKNIDIKFIKNEKNIGSSKNFEKAISLCSGDIIFLSDQDDVWLHDKIKFTLNAFNKYKNIDLVFSNAFLTDENLNVLPKTLWQNLNFNNKKINIIKSERAFNLLLKTNYATGATIAFKKSLLHVFLPLPDIWIHDHYLAFICSICSNIYPIKTPLIYYRQHEKQQIGTLSTNLFEKITYTIKGKISIPRYYFFRMNKTMEILNGKNILTKEMIKELKSYSDFLYMRQKIVHYNYLKKFIIILFYINKYIKYTTGLKHAVIDFITQYNKNPSIS